MGELFEKTIPVQPLAWTGERLTTAVSGQIEIEHLHRYCLARELSRGCDVLDIACGEGYGSALLAQVAASVVGVDVSGEVIGHAKATYRDARLRFEVGDVRAIPLPDASVDRVISFETLENFYEHAAFMAEVARVLRPDGMLVISSPERDVYSPPGSDANPFHVRELTRAEFEALVRASFPHVRVLAQRPMIGSALLADGEGAGRHLTFEKRGTGHYEVSEGLPRAPYLVAVASMQPLGPVPSSVFVESSDIGTVLGEARATPAIAEQLAQERGKASQFAAEMAVQTRLHQAAIEAERARAVEITTQMSALQYNQAALDFERARSSELAATLLSLRGELSLREDDVQSLQAQIDARNADMEQILAQSNAIRLAARRMTLAERGPEPWRAVALAAEETAAEIEQLRGYRQHYIQLYQRLMDGIRKVVPRRFRKSVKRRLLGSAPEPW